MIRSIVDNNCGCLMPDACLKRSYWVDDIENNEERVQISICNEYLRLKLNEARQKQNWHYPDVSEVIEAILSKHVKIYPRVWPMQMRWSNDIFDRNINLRYCSRPYIIQELPMRKALEICTENRYHFIKDRVISELTNYLKANFHYKKYKTKYANCKTLINKWSKEWCLEKKSLIMNEIIIDILTVNSK